MHPLQPDVLHPPRGARDCARMEVKRGPYADHYSVDLAPVLGHPMLLFGAAETYKHHVRTRRIDRRYALSIFLHC